MDFTLAYLGNFDGHLNVKVMLEYVHSKKDKPVIIATIVQVGVTLEMSPRNAS